MAALNIKRSIIEAIDKGNWSGLVSLDLTSAFDVINHSKLFSRLQKLGIPEDVVGLVRNWLSDPVLCRPGWGMLNWQNPEPRYGAGIRPWPNTFRTLYVSSLTN